MSKIKILLGLCILTSSATLVFGFLLQVKKKEATEKLNHISQTLSEVGISSADVLADVTSCTLELKKATEKLAILQTKNDASQDENKKLSEKTASLEAQQADILQEKQKLEEDLKRARSNSAEREKQLAQIKKTLKGEKPEAVVKKLENLEERSARAEKESQILVEKINVLNTELTKLQKPEKEEVSTTDSSTSVPVTVTAKIIAINKAWNFVVLDTGKGRVKEGVEASVFRGNSFVGKIKTVSVDPRHTIADILPQYVDVEWKVGDQVVF